MDDENRITYFGQTDARNKRVKFGIKSKDRTKHVYVIGKTGMGKSTLLENLAAQDIQNGEGVCFIDPHGKTAELMLEYVPKERIRDVIYIAPFDIEYPISFNVLESVDPDKRHLVVSGLMSTFKKIWVDAWSARMEYILTNTLLALLEVPGTTLLSVNRMLSDKAYRNEIVAQVKDPSVKAFWVKEFANYTERMAAESIPAIQNKVGQFTANPLIRNMIGQSKSTFDFRQAMDSRKIIIINLSKGRVGDENMKLLGGMLVTKIYLAAMSRADLPDRVMKVMPNFYLFVDEFQNFANQSFADILSEARKYKLNLTIAHQYIEQMEEEVRAAVFGNVGSMIVFRVGATDAEVLEKEFSPQFTLEDLANLGFAQIYIKLMIDGLTSAPFSASTLPPIPHPDVVYVNEVIAASREQFARPRAEIEAEVLLFHEPTVVGKKAAPAAPSASGAPAASGAASAPVSVAPSAPTPKPKAVPAPGAISSAIAAAMAKPVAEAAKPSPAPVKTAPAAPVAPARAPVPTTSVTPTPAAPIKQTQPIQPIQSARLVQHTQPKPVPSSSKPASQPATHKPFSGLSELLAKVAQPQTPSKKPTPPLDKPIASMAPAPKPIPLSELKEPLRKPDPKVPTPQNLNSLKNALAAAMAKKAAPVAPVVPAMPPSAPVVAQTIEKSQTQSPAAQTEPKPAPVQKAVQEGQKEVPEEVLKKVLKVD